MKKELKEYMKKYTRTELLLQAGIVIAYTWLLLSIAFGTIEPEPHWFLPHH